MKKTAESKSGATKQASAKVKPPTYQPTAQEMNEGFEMPGASMETVRQAVFKPLDKEDKTLHNRRQ